MTHKAKLTVAFVVVTAILSPLGCGDGPDQNIRVRAVDQTDRGFGGKRPRILSVNAALNPNNALMIDFQVTVSRPARVSVTYFDPVEPEFVVSKPTELDMSHQFTIVRLKAETEYHYKVMAVDEHDDRSPPQLGKFVTGSLPPGLLAPVTRIELVRGTGTTYPTLFDFNHQDPPVAGQFQPQFNGHVVLDSKARIVWYHVNTFRPRPGHSLMPFEIDRLPNGNFVYDVGPAGRSWDGRLL